MVSKVFFLCLLAFTVSSADDLENLRKIEETLIDGIQDSFNSNMDDLENARFSLSSKIANAYLPVVADFYNLSRIIQNYRELAANKSRSIASCLSDEVLSRNLIITNITDILSCTTFNTFDLIQDYVELRAGLINQVKAVIPECSVSTEDFDDCVQTKYRSLQNTNSAYSSEISFEYQRSDSMITACLDESTQRRINHTRVVGEEFIACAENIIKIL
ncbi:hypothetical protein HHI36_000200 [Cryptolaemus montrouzieri]|uniref:Uncharacterized protein n=1 Tax=Cryptolaemus montrouzieri TaxID=559131 RepID=A0ABD2P4M1_9CUCU